MAKAKRLELERERIAQEDVKNASDFIIVKRKSSDAVLVAAREQGAEGKYDEALASFNYAYDITREPSLRKDILIEKNKVKKIAEQQEKVEVEQKKEAFAISAAQK